MSPFRPSRSHLPALVVLAVVASGCTADEAATVRVDLALLGLFIYGLLATVLQATSMSVALTRRRPRGKIAYGATSLLAAIAVLGAILGMLEVAELPARLRPRVWKSLLLVVGEAVVIVGAWFAVTYIRHASRWARPPEDDMTPGTSATVRALILAGAVLFLAALGTGTWLLLRGVPTLPL